MFDPPEIDLSDPEFKRNPYPVYRRMREEMPVCRIRFGRWFKAWLVTRYQDVLEMWVLRITAPITRNLFSLDPPDHTWLRAMVQKAFTAGFVEGMRLRFESVAEELLDRAARQQRMDVIRDYALPLPMTIITEMLGIPLADRERFPRWTDAVTDVRGVPQVLWAIMNGLRFLRYNRKLTRSRRKKPKKDLTTSLITAGESGQKLDEDELLNMLCVLLIAGYETTVNLIGNGTLALLEHPGEMAVPLSEPSRMPSAVEEFLRYDSPVELATSRWALCDVTLAGVTIPKGDLVWAGSPPATWTPCLPKRLQLPDRSFDFGLSPLLQTQADLQPLWGCQRNLERGFQIRATPHSNHDSLDFHIRAMLEAPTISLGCGSWQLLPTGPAVFPGQ